MKHKNVISLYPQNLGIRHYQTSTTPLHPRKGDIWTYPVTGEELIWYVDMSGNASFIEFGDGAEWGGLIAAGTEIKLPSSPSVSQIFTHGNRKWQWNGKFWKSLYPVISVRGGTFSD